jgi:hypothetical protein
MNGSAARALVFAALVTGGAALLHRSGVSLPLLLTSIGVALLLGLGVYTLQRLWGWLWSRARAHAWRHEEGRFHAFDGVPLRVQDDGRHVWLAGAGLLRVLRSRDREDVLAARHAGRWRRDDAGQLWLRVDAVVEHLATMPARDAPRTIRLRRYLERELLYPAAQRRARGPAQG